MQMLIEFRADGLCIPINYSHIVQGIIYNKLRSIPGLGTFLHDTGFKNDEKAFRLFTFSKLDGHYSIKNKMITFDDKVRLEIRSPQVLLIKILSESFEKYGITFGNRTFVITDIYVSDFTVEESDIDAVMKTPICVHSTDSLTGFTTYYTPEDEEFYSCINKNFKNKYEAYFGIRPDEDITIIPSRVSVKDRFVTSIKGIYISGWHGRYHISGKRKYLDFLYNTGLGEKNSQGFGMFDIEK